MATSALTGAGVAPLRATLVETVGKDAISQVARERVVLNTRLVQLLGAARDKIAVLKEGVETRRPLELIALDARDLLSQYEAAVGRKSQDDLLDVIFSRFCIGK